MHKYIQMLVKYYIFDKQHQFLEISLIKILDLVYFHISFLFYQDQV